MKIIQIMVFTCILALSAHAQNTNLLLATLPIEEIKRSAAMDEFFTSAKKVVELSNDPEARQVFDFVQQHSLLCFVNNEGQIIRLNVPRTNELFAFVPIFPEDTNILSHLAIVAGGEAMGEWFKYNGVPMMAVRFDYHLSWSTEGLLFLHEGNHAKGRWDRGNKNETVKDSEIDELRVREFQRRINCLIGGEHYDNVVKREMKQINDGLLKHNMKIGEVFASAGPYDPELDLAFGKAQSRADMCFRVTDLNLDANFRLLETSYTGKQLADYKMSFIYMQDGNLKHEDIK